MRVAFLTNGFLHYTCELTNALHRAGHSIAIIAGVGYWDFVGTGSDDVRKDYRELLAPGIALYWVEVPLDTNPMTIGANARSIASMMKFVRLHRPDVLHIMDTADYRILAAAVVSKSRRPLVLTVHDADTHPGDAKNKMEFMRPWLRRMADAVIVHGKEIQERLLLTASVPETRVRCIPRGPYMMYHRWASAADSDISDGKTILFFGRVSQYKGLDYLIQCAPIVRKEIPDARFVLAGSGPDWPRCRALIEDPRGFVIREEKVPEPEVARLFEEASVVVLPYIEASQSGVLFIAYAFGKPVVVTSVGSLPEVVDEGETGLIVPPRDVDALASAIVRTLKDPDLRRAMGAKARQKVTTGDLSWESIAARTAEMYNEVVARRRRGHRGGG